MMVSLSLQQLSKSFAGKCIFSNLNLELNEFGIVAVVAENGVGKSTLLPMIAGMLDFDAGNIFINDQPYAPLITMNTRNLWPMCQIKALFMIFYKGRSF